MVLKNVRSINLAHDEKISNMVADASEKFLENRKEHMKTAKVTGKITS